MGRTKAVEELELTDEEKEFWDNCTRASIAHLSGTYICHYSEESYSHSLRRAFEDFKERNANKKLSYTLTMVDVFFQKAGEKAILVSYDVHPKEGYNEVEL